MRRALLRFGPNANGSAAIEYSLIAAGVALGLLVGLMALSDELQAVYASIEAAIASLSLL